MGQPAGKEAQASPQHLAKPGDEAHFRRVGAEILQERPEDAAGTLIGHVGEQAHDAQADDEADGGRAGIVPEERGAHACLFLD